MKLSLGADEKLSIADKIHKLLIENGHEVFWHGPQKSGETMPWPEVARRVANDVSSGRAEEGILLCWTGTGVCLAANKIKGIRAALCVDAETARGARLWNNANVLCLSMRLTSEPLAAEILGSWFNTRYQPNPGDDACLELIKTIESESNLSDNNPQIVLQ